MIKKNAPVLQDLKKQKNPNPPVLQYFFKKKNLVLQDFFF